jgi:hypothetical protein
MEPVSGAPRAGDILLNPPPDAVTSGHVGVASGSDAAGRYIGAEMGKTGAEWQSHWGPGGERGMTTVQVFRICVPDATAPRDGGANEKND